MAIAHDGERQAPVSADNTVNRSTPSLGAIARVTTTRDNTGCGGGLPTA